MRKYYLSIVALVASVLTVTAQVFPTSFSLSAPETIAPASHHKILTTAEVPNLTNEYSAPVEPSGTPYSYAFDTYAVNEDGSAYITSMAVKIYFDDQDVYIQNMVFHGRDNSYTKCRLIEGDRTNGKIEVTNGSAYAVDKVVYIGTTNEEGYLIPDKNATAFTFTIADEVISLDITGNTDNHSYLLGYDLNNNLIGYNADNKYVPMEEVTNISIPENVTMEDYMVKSEAIFNISPSEFIASVGFDGEYVYIKGALESVPDCIMRGTITDETTVTIPQGLFGIFSDAYISVYVAEIVTNETTGESVGQIYPELPVTLTYDANDKSLKCNSILVFMAGSSIIGKYYQPVMTPYDASTGVIIPDSAWDSDYVLATLDKFYDDETRNTYKAYRKTVSQDDYGNYYFKGIYPEDEELAFLGTLDSTTGKIKVSTPQFMGKDKDGNLVYLYAANHEMNLATWPNYSYYTKIEESSVLEFDYSEDTGIISFQGAVATAKLGSNPSFGISNPSWEYLNYSVTTVPDGVEFETYSLQSEKNFDHQLYYDIETQTIEGGRAGMEFYFRGIDLNESRTAPIKGSLQGPGLTVQTPQLISLESNMMFLYSGSVDENNEAQVSNTPYFTFNYDRDAGIFTYDGTIIIKDYFGNTLYYFDNVKIALYAPDEATVPADPTANPDEVWDTGLYQQLGRNLTAWNFPNEDTRGNWISPKDMAYSVYVDNELFTFDADIYYDVFTEDTTEIPMELENNHFNHWRTERRISLAANPTETVGVQSHFYNPLTGVKTSSKIVNYNINTGEFSTTDPAGIEDVAIDRTVKEVNYYDISGRRISNAPAEGFYIEFTTYTDGTTSVVKKIGK